MNEIQNPTTDTTRRPLSTHGRRDHNSTLLIADLEKCFLKKTSNTRGIAFADPHKTCAAGSEAKTVLSQSSNFSDADGGHLERRVSIDFADQSKVRPNSESGEFLTRDLSDAYESNDPLFEASGERTRQSDNDSLRVKTEEDVSVPTMAVPVSERSFWESNKDNVFQEVKENIRSIYVKIPDTVWGVFEKNVLGLANSVETFITNFNSKWGTKEAWNSQFNEATLVSLSEQYELPISAIEARYLYLIETHFLDAIVEQYFNQPLFSVEPSSGRDIQYFKETVMQNNFPMHLQYSKFLIQFYEEYTEDDFIELMVLFPNEADESRNTNLSPENCYYLFSNEENAGSYFLLQSIIRISEKIREVSRQVSSFPTQKSDKDKIDQSSALESAVQHKRWSTLNDSMMTMLGKDLPNGFVPKAFSDLKEFWEHQNFDKFFSKINKVLEDLSNHWVKTQKDSAKKLFCSTLKRLCDIVKASHKKTEKILKNKDPIKFSQKNDFKKDIFPLQEALKSLNESFKKILDSERIESGILLEKSVFNKIIENIIAFLRFIFSFLRIPFNKQVTYGVDQRDALGIFQIALQNTEDALDLLKILDMKGLENKKDISSILDDISSSQLYSSYLGYSAGQKGVDAKGDAEEGSLLKKKRPPHVPEPKQVQISEGLAKVFASIDSSSAADASAVLVQEMRNNNLSFGTVDPTDGLIGIEKLAKKSPGYLLCLSQDQAPFRKIIESLKLSSSTQDKDSQDAFKKELNSGLLNILKNKNKDLMFVIMHHFEESAFFIMDNKSMLFKEILVEGWWVEAARFLESKFEWILKNRYYNKVVAEIRQCIIWRSNECAKMQKRNQQDIKPLRSILRQCEKYQNYALINGLREGEAKAQQELAHIIAYGDSKKFVDLVDEGCFYLGQRIPINMIPGTSIKEQEFMNGETTVERAAVLMGDIKLLEVVVQNKFSLGYTADDVGSYSNLLELAVRFSTREIVEYLSGLPIFGEVNKHKLIDIAKERKSLLSVKEGKRSKILGVFQKTQENLREANDILKFVEKNQNQKTPLVYLNKPVHVGNLMQKDTPLLRGVSMKESYRNGMLLIHSRQVSRYAQYTQCNPCSKSLYDALAEQNASPVELDPDSLGDYCWDYVQEGEDTRTLFLKYFQCDPKGFFANLSDLVKKMPSSAWKNIAVNMMYQLYPQDYSAVLQYLVSIKAVSLFSIIDEDGTMLWHLVLHKILMLPCYQALLLMSSQEKNLEFTEDMSSMRYDILKNLWPSNFDAVVWNEWGESSPLQYMLLSEWSDVIDAMTDPEKRKQFSKFSVRKLAKNIFPGVDIFHSGDDTIIRSAVLAKAGKFASDGNETWDVALSEYFINQQEGNYLFMMNSEGKDGLEAAIDNQQFDTLLLLLQKHAQLANEYDTPSLVFSWMGLLEKTLKFLNSEDFANMTDKEQKFEDIKKCLCIMQYTIPKVWPSCQNLVLEEVQKLQKSSGKNSFLLENLGKLVQSLQLVEKDRLPYAELEEPVAPVSTSEEYEFAPLATSEEYEVDLTGVAEDELALIGAVEDDSEY